MHGRLTEQQDDVEHQTKADYIVNTVLQGMDLDHDGKISPEELERVGLDGLPNFSQLGAEGHHYDVESGEFGIIFDPFVLDLIVVPYRILLTS